MNCFRISKSLLIAGFLGLLMVAPAVDAQELETSAVVKNLNTPWDIEWGPNDQIWLTERNGRIARADPVTGKVTDLKFVDEVVERSEGGLMGLELHPDFPDTPHLFVAYNYNDYEVKVVRYTYQMDSLSNSLLLLEGIEGNTIHNGCRLVIGPDRHLFITTGDAGNSSLSQDTSSLNGKVLRLNLDGSIPADNPFGNNPVWSLGHRNPQGLVHHDGFLYSSEHGPQNDDEFNIIKKGRNYGWPDVQGFCDAPEEATYCSNYNIVEPLESWTPPEAVCGIDFYDHSLIERWTNSVLMTSLGFSGSNRGKTLFQLQLNKAGNGIDSIQPFFEDQFGRLRDVCVNPEGHVYLATSNRDGRGTPTANDDRIIKISPESTGIESHKNDRMEVKPNPLKNAAVVHLWESREQVTYTIFNQQGKALHSRKLENVRSWTIHREPNWPGGVYYLRVSVDNQVLGTQKLLLE